MTPAEPGPAFFLAAGANPVLRLGVRRLPRPGGQPPVAGGMLTGPLPGPPVVGS